MNAIQGRDFGSSLGALRRALDRAGAAYALIGGLALVARGVQRLTRDVDLVVWSESVEEPGLLATLKAAEITPRVTDVEGFARRTHVYLLRHDPSRVEIDLGVGYLPFQHELIARAEGIDLLGVTIPVATVEDLLVLKAIAWRPQDRQDIAQLAERYRTSIRADLVLSRFRDFSLLLEEPERVDELARLLARPHHA